MAIYHLSVKPMSRKGGRSATAAIAYRSAEKIHDLTSDQVFDYTRKRGVEHTEIVLPTAAARLDINWARDRQQLWNAAEMAEKRKDARVAREYEVALPHELSAGQRVELVRAFAAELANRYGVAVDFAIHAPHRNGDERNHHAHIMTTTREITATGLGRKTDIELGDRDRGKKGLASAADEIESLRARWGVLTNEHLMAQGIAARVDHRSLAAQGIDREPTSHLGPAVSGMERRGMVTEVGKRIEAEALAAAQQRLERAAELGRLEREAAQVQRSILDLSGDLKAARAQRDQGRESGLDRGAKKTPDRTAEKAPAAAPERGRFDGLQLSALIWSQKSKEHGEERAPSSAERSLAPALDLKSDAPGTPLKPSTPAESEPIMAEGRAAPASQADPIDIDWAALRAEGRALGESWRQELHREQAEEQRVERARQEQQRQQRLEAERIASERQAQEAREAREQAARQRTVQQFKDLAANRQVQSFGYGDQSERWLATPAALRETIDRFNALLPMAREQVLARLAHEPTQARGLQKLMDERTKLVKELGYGMER